ncbi:metallophosphoesterase [Brooklawnia cerclae]|nr:metallophosphoesterase [Brooklawnia cerclae]
MSAGRRLGGALAAVTGLGATVTFGAWVEARAFIVRRVEVPVLPAGQRELRVLHISDMHLMPYQHRKIDFLADLGGLRPDLVVSTGDHASSPEAIGPLVDALGPLLDVPGVFVFGSNDFAEPTFHNPASYLFRNSTPDKAGAELPWWELQAAFTSRGWADLDNQRARLEVAGRTIDLRGTGDAHAGLDDYSAVAGQPSSDADLTLGVTHAPYRRVLDAMVADGVDMVFAGHTHGGQICLPVNRAIIDNCDLPTSQASGLSSWTSEGRTAPLHVSAGIGTSPMAPIRLFCRPEATLLRLTARA